MSKADWVQAVRRVDKPWGHEEWFALVDGKFCGKAIHVRDGHSLSLQYHERKEETIAVQSGCSGSRSARTSRPSRSSSCCPARRSISRPAPATG